METRKETLPELPTVRFGPHRVTRLIVGGNPFCGHAHNTEEMRRDMLDYYTPERVVEVLGRCQRAGINAFQGRGDFHRVLHWRELFRRGGGRLHFIAQTASEMHDVLENIRVLAAAGAIGVYQHGTETDKLWHAGRIDRSLEALACMRDAGVQVGLGTHIPEVVEYAEEHDWDLDFYMTCFYNLSRAPRESELVTGKQETEPEEYLAEDRERMCETIRATDKTCLAFKILAAGRHCESQDDVQAAFDYAFGHIKPTDAVVVGMFPKYVDQVTLNVGHTAEAIARAEPDSSS
ncbi:MAG: hypothetical protein ACOC8E_02805 [Planctomycetota bacterium]